MALTKIDDRGLTTPIDLLDSEKIRFGTGNDLEIYHVADGNSFINDTATAGQFIIQAVNGHDIKHSNGELAIRTLVDGSTSLYYNGNKTLYTDSYGAVVVAPEGGAAELQIWGDEGDDNNDKYMLDVYDGRFRIKNYTSGSWETNIECNGDNNVELYYDGVKKLETASDKVMFSAHAKVATSDTYDLGAAGARWRDLFISNDIDILDDGKILLGASDDLKIYHDGTKNYLLSASSTNTEIWTDTFYVKSVTGSGEAIIKGSVNGAVELYYDNSKKFYTHSTGCAVTGELAVSDSITLADGDKLKFGHGYDLEIYHDGSSSYIANTTGPLVITQHNNDIYLRPKTAEEGIIINNDGAVELYYDGVKTFETASNNNFHYKHCDPYAADTLNLGHLYRWKQLYANNATSVSSDRTTKNTILDSDLGLSFINQLRPVSFKKNNQGDSIHYGLIAQEVEDVIINTGKSLEEFAAIDKPTDKTMGLAYNEFISPLIKAVQELSAEVEALKAK